MKTGNINAKILGGGHHIEWIIQYVVEGLVDWECGVNSCRVMLSVMLLLVETARQTPDVSIL